MRVRFPPPGLVLASFDRVSARSFSFRGMCFICTFWKELSSSFAFSKYFAIWGSLAWSFQQYATSASFCVRRTIHMQDPWDMVVRLVFGAELCHKVGQCLSFDGRSFLKSLCGILIARWTRLAFFLPGRAFGESVSAADLFLPQSGGPGSTVGAS
ncbi:hypothetical protein PIB30_072193 [Stylosanthes scabra]|uniref:Uncharacterized protein n=1 Tax=Stylosanthes scabra TaxID=79078 RepID=A0ABU6XM86_9FABA|nr:hypothetical protein [Stylosanthes scabra]